MENEETPVSEITETTEAITIEETPVSKISEALEAIKIEEKPVSKRTQVFLEALNAKGRTKPMTFTMTQRSRVILDVLERETGNSKSGLIREALNLLAEKYRHI